jgi:hypothetical protein
MFVGVIELALLASALLSPIAAGIYLALRLNRRDQPGAR